MNFLAPWALVLSVAAAVPLFLHLLRRRSGERVDFPALRYLLRAEREHAREVRLRNLLLLAVRIAAVLAIAGALARPTAPLPGVGHPPSAVALVLDNSASSAAVVGGSTLLEQQRRAAQAVIAAARPADLFTLVTVDGEVRGGSAVALAEALEAVTPIAGAGDIAAALRRADAALAAMPLPERRIVVLTDAQATAWASVRGDSLAAPRVLFVPEGDRPANRGLVGLSADPPTWTPRGTVRAQWRGDSASWRLVIDGAGAGRGVATNGADIVAPAQAAARGWIAGQLELEADEYRGDDIRHFAAFVGEPPAVVADAGSPFLREAVATLVASGRARSGSAVALVPATRARRRAVVFAPNDPLQVAEANRALAQAGIPWRYGARREGPATVRGRDLDGTSARAWFALEPLGPARTDTLALVGREPWAVAGEGFVLVASAADPAATDLPLRAAFVPWIERLLAERLGEAAGAAEQRGASRPILVPAAAEAVELPNGETQAVTPSVPWPAPSAAGVYFWRRGETRIGALVVNPEPQESDLTPMPTDSLAAALGAERQTSSPDALARAALAAGGRRALDTPLLLMALALLVAESWLARRGRGARPAD